jgi:catechol 2,3-dioxygenase-like lactoylglutathione lyase family enzyme
MKTCLIILMLALATLCNGQDKEIKLQPYFSAIMVSNVEQSVQWYSNTFGLKLRNRFDSKEGLYKQVIMESPEMLIELVELKSMIKPDEAVKDKPKGTAVIGFSKFGFIVTQFDELHQVLTDKKVNFAGRTVRDDFSGKRTFLIRDPDDNLLQFFER